LDVTQSAANIEVPEAGLKQDSWSNTYNSPGSNLARPWAQLCDGTQVDCIDSVRTLTIRNLTALAFEQSDVLNYAAYLGWEHVVRLLVRIADQLQCNNITKSRALCEAVQSNQPKVIDILLDAGADMNSEHLPVSVLSMGILSHSQELVTHLLARGANPNAPCRTFGHVFRTAHRLLQLDSASANYVLRLLVEKGADANGMLTEDENVPVTMTREGYHESLLTIKAFLIAGADCNASSRTHTTALMAAAASSGFASMEIMDLLYERGADVNAFGGLYGTALLAALNLQFYNSNQKMESYWNGVQIQTYRALWDCLSKSQHDTQTSTYGNTD
jgi:ankyrin repeat protein